MRVAVDVDNVTLDWQNGWADQYEQWFDRPVDLVARGRWDGCVSGTHFESMTEVFHWMEVGDIWFKLPPIRGAFGGIFDLQHAGHDVVFCTARPEGKGQLSAWALGRQHGVPVEFRGPAEKHLTVADVWIDDSPEVLANLRAHGKRAIRFVQPWNQPHQARLSAYCWQDVLTHVHELALEAA